jgi:hypothetical protein
MPAHIELAENLPFIHRDTFDRLPAAAAKADGMTIVTADADTLPPLKPVLTKQRIAIVYLHGRIVYCSGDTGYSAHRFRNFGKKQ